MSLDLQSMQNFNTIVHTEVLQSLRMFSTDVPLSQVRSGTCVITCKEPTGKNIVQKIVKEHLENEEDNRCLFTVTPYTQYLTITIQI